MDTIFFSTGSIPMLEARKMPFWFTVTWSNLPLVFNPSQLSPPRCLWRRPRGSSGSPRSLKEDSRSHTRRTATRSASSSCCRPRPVRTSRITALTRWHFTLPRKIITVKPLDWWAGTIWKSGIAESSHTTSLSMSVRYEYLLGINKNTV